ncbi:MAG: hypothetical protein WD118_09650 [Phycisphaeraceae bacterium]
MTITLRVVPFPTVRALRYRAQGPCGLPHPHPPPPIGRETSPPPGAAAPAAKTLCLRVIFAPPHCSHASSASASAILRSASVVVWHFSQTYSYTGMEDLVERDEGASLRQSIVRAAAISGSRTWRRPWRAGTRKRAAADDQ